LSRSVAAALALMLAAWSSPSLAQPAPASVSFKIFLRGGQVGTEQVEVRRSADGFVISGSNRLAPPIDVITNRCEVRYDAQGRPLDATVDSIVRGQYASSHTVFSDGAATSTVAQSGRQPVTKTDKIGADDVVLTNGFFGLYEGLSDRLRSLAAGAELKAYVLPQAEVAIRVDTAAD
jgi:hypothetical protein